MRNRHLLIFFLAAIASLFLICSKASLSSNKISNYEEENRIEFKRLQLYASQVKRYCRENNYSTSVCFLADMKIPNGRKRFFVYDLEKDTVIASGLVAHGNCYSAKYLTETKFSNIVSCGCSAEGKYKIGYKYNGSFGTAFKLYGLDSSNSNAFERAIVLHSHSCVPDNEIFPGMICNSAGCPTVSPNFLAQLSGEIGRSSKPILLWMFQ